MLSNKRMLLSCFYVRLLYLKRPKLSGCRWCSTSLSTARQSSTCSRSIQYGRPTTFRNRCQSIVMRHLRTRAHGKEEKIKIDTCFESVLLPQSIYSWMVSWLPYALQKGVLWLMESRRFFDEQNNFLPVRMSICRMTLKTSLGRNLNTRRLCKNGSKTNWRNLPSTEMQRVWYTMKTEGKRSLYKWEKRSVIWRQRYEYFFIFIVICNIDPSKKTLTYLRRK